MALRPVLATDAKVDLDGLLSGVTSKNFNSKSIASRLATMTKGKLKEGASLTAVAAALDAMEDDPTEDEEPEDDKEAKEAKDKAARDKRAKDMKRGKDRKGAMDRVRARDSEEEKNPPKTPPSVRNPTGPKTPAAPRMARSRKPRRKPKTAIPRTARPLEDKKAKDKEPSGMDAKAVERIVRLAVDQAVTRTEERLMGNLHAVDEARRDVEPYIGAVTGKVESARDLYVMALDGAPGIKLDGSESLSALRNMVKLLPIPGDVPPRHEFALDAAAAGFSSRFPNAGRIGRA